MHLRINLGFVSAALGLLKDLNAMPTLAPDLSEASKVKTTLNFRIKGFTLGYDPPEDLGREAHMEFLRASERPHEVEIKDIRGFENEFKLNVHGFAYVKDEVMGLEKCENDQDYNNLLKPGAENLVKEMTQAKAVYAFDSRIRDKDPNWKGEGVNRTPVPSVHSDFSTSGAEERIAKAMMKNSDDEEVKKFEELAKDPNNKLVIIHLWRPLETVKRNPLTMCDWRSVEAAKDRFALRPGGPGKCECMQWYFNPKNQFYYLSEQKPDEVAMFVQYDSAAEEHMTLPHASFQGSDEKDLPIRRSIEIRVMAILSKNQDMAGKVAKKEV